MKPHADEQENFDFLDNTMIRDRFKDFADAGKSTNRSLSSTNFYIAPPTIQRV